MCFASSWDKRRRGEGEEPGSCLGSSQWLVTASIFVKP